MAYLEVKDANGVTRRLAGRFDGSDFIPYQDINLAADAAVTLKGNTQEGT